jgi:hypothetical protein
MRFRTDVGDGTELCMTFPRRLREQREQCLVRYGQRLVSAWEQTSDGSYVGEFAMVGITYCAWQQLVEITFAGARDVTEAGARRMT